MSGLAPNAATATDWSDKPPARRMKIRKCVPRRSCALLAIFNVEMASGTIINRLRLMRGKNGLWVAMPSLKRLDIGGDPIRDVDGKPIYDAIVEFRNRDVTDRFTTEVLEALRREHPEALGERGR